MTHEGIGSRLAQADSRQQWWQLALEMAETLSGADIAYAVDGPASLLLQGVEVAELAELTLSVQWDQFNLAREILAPGAPVVEESDQAYFRCEQPVRILCRFNYVVATDPDRLMVERDGCHLWAISVLAYRRRAVAGDPLVPLINRHLARLQAELNRQNALAWTANPYDAWVNRYGEPGAAAEKLLKHPKRRLAALWPHLGDIRGSRIVNLMGSQGSKAVALALLGAQVTVVDVSPENARYAQELAAAAGVALRYVVSDVLALPADELTADYDLALMELGILHYFVDLDPLFKVVTDLLRPGGRLVLQDFHPVSTKLIASNGRKHKVVGNYFDSRVMDTQVAYSGYLSEGAAAPRVRLRKWTLGEVVTAVASAGLCLRTLEEEPNHKLDDTGLPKTFTLVAVKL
ncbi:MAG TPA: class I SAM-dependent methyltransferase [Symbiobacteriaceae bacterium]|nr:class I SAM-dependent methyltransferase [Symbiobacteriaceae bacterium]